MLHWSFAYQSNVRRLFLFLLFFSTWQLVVGQQISPFLHLDKAAGLSQNSASCIFEDHLGLIWIGTAEGLNCFDGSNVTHYLNGIDSYSLAGNFVTSIREDRWGNIWVATTVGLSVYHRTSGKMTRLALPKGLSKLTNVVRISIITSGEGNVRVYFPNWLQQYTQCNGSIELISESGHALLSDVYGLTGDSTVIFEFDAAETIALNPVQTINFFRTIQEAIQNAVKYAQADTIRVNVKCDVQGILKLR